MKRVPLTTTASTGATNDNNNNKKSRRSMPASAAPANEKSTTTTTTASTGAANDNNNNKKRRRKKDKKEDAYPYPDEGLQGLLLYIRNIYKNQWFPSINNKGEVYTTYGVGIASKKNRTVMKGNKLQYLLLLKLLLEPNPIQLQQ